MKVLIPAFVGSLLLVMGGASAQAEVVRFVFDGTVTTRFNNGLPNPSDIFGLNVNVDDAVSGSFSIDTSASVFGSVVGPVAGSATSYTQVPPQEIRVNLAGGVFTSSEEFLSSVVNDYQDNVNFPAFEQFSVADGVSTGYMDTTGDTILLDGNPETARLAIDFRDLDATAFNSTDLPTSLDLASFSFVEGSIVGERPSGQLNPFSYYVAFRVDSISVAAVPESSSMALLACIAGLTASRNRRRRHS